MKKKKKKTNKSVKSKLLICVLTLLIAYFFAQGELPALNEFSTLEELPSLSEISLPYKETSFEKKVQQLENLEIPAPMLGKKEHVLNRSNYSLSFNKETNLPNWVAWRLDKKKLIERVSRDRYKFLADPDMKGKMRW